MLFEDVDDGLEGGERRKKEKKTSLETRGCMSTVSPFRASRIVSNCPDAMDDAKRFVNTSLPRFDRSGVGVFYRKDGDRRGVQLRAASGDRQAHLLEGKKLLSVAGLHYHLLGRISGRKLGFFHRR
jgi:hypothetical protein